MNQMQAFIDKARSDSALMAKLDALGASGAEASEVVALAAEYGFTVTAEDIRQAAAACSCRTGELTEAELDAVAGGATQNRYNPDVCGKYTKVEYECVGFLARCWCDHHRGNLTTERVGQYYRYTCAMGRYDYIGDMTGDPV